MHRGPTNVYIQTRYVATVPLPYYTPTTLATEDYPGAE